VADIVTHVLGSVVGKIFLVFVTFSIFACGLVIYITASRVTWAMARDERFPGWKAMRKVSPKFGTPLIATVVVGVLLEIVLAAFADRTHSLFDLFSAATLMPAIIYFVTVLLYVVTRHKLPGEHGFNLGKWESLVIAVSIVWLLFELSIFRDSSFSTPWIYVAIMVAIGLVYFAYMLVTRRSLAMPAPLATPEEQLHESGSAAGEGS
jgi:amino acid transporter